jgi:hypothetical protein
MRWWASPLEPFFAEAVSAGSLREATAAASAADHALDASVFSVTATITRTRLAERRLDQR